MKRSFPVAAFFSRVLLPLLMSLAAITAPGAPDLTQTKLLGKWTGDPAGNRLGSSAAVSDQWLALGAEEADEPSSLQGGVQLFTPAGSFARRLLPPTTAPNQRFGSAIELSGDRVIVGAPASGAPGKVHVFNGKTGALIRTLTPAISVNDDRFGASLSVEGDLLAVGAIGGVQRVWLFQLSTGQALGNVEPSDPQANAFFGYSVDLQGGLMVVGAPLLDDGGADRGGVYWYNILNPVLPVQVARTLIPGTDASDLCGAVVRLHQSFAVVGCPGMAAGDGRIVVLDPRGNLQAPVVSKTLQVSSALSFGNSMDVSDGLIIGADLDSTVGLFDLSSSSSAPIRELRTPGFKQVNSLALQGNTLLLGMEGDDTQGNFAGAGVVLRQVTRPLPLRKVTAKRDYAPGVVEAQFNTFRDVRMNANGQIAIAGGLTGAGSGGGKDVGIWDTLGGAPLNLAGKSRLTLDGATVSSLEAPLLKASETLAVPATTIPASLIFRARINGAQSALYRDDGTTVKRAFSAGDLLDGSPLLSLGQVSAPMVDNSLAFQCKFKTGGATAAGNDSAVVWHRFQHNSAPPINSETSLLREGAASGFSTAPGELVAPVLGEMGSAFALTGNRFLCVAQLTGDAARNQGLIARDTLSGALNPGFRKGVNEVPDNLANPISGVTFSAFLGIASDTSNRLLFRARVQGSNVTKTTNEGLFGSFNPGQVGQVLRTGQPFPGSTGVTISGIKAFWPSAEQQVAWVTLKGSQVNASNDQALILFQIGAPVDKAPLVLMREGDAAPGLTPARVGSLLQVDVEPTHGQYLILASLSGVPASKNLALFRGHSKAPLASIQDQPIRLPYPILRKGILFDDQPGKLQSFSLPANNRSLSGAGNIGLGTVLQASSATGSTRLVSTLVFDNGVTQVGAGAP